jgi:hypothetical protein
MNTVMVPLEKRCIGASTVMGSENSCFIPANVVGVFSLHRAHHLGVSDSKGFSSNTYVFVDWFIKTHIVSNATRLLIDFIPYSRKLKLHFPIWTTLTDLN